MQDSGPADSGVPIAPEAVDVVENLFNEVTKDNNNFHKSKSKFDVSCILC